MNRIPQTTLLGLAAVGGIASLVQAGDLALVPAQRLLALDHAPGDRFGGALTRDGDTLVVGARRAAGATTAAGAAYVFDFDGAAWAQTQKLARTGGDSLDEFGTAVALLGEWLFVGAPDADQLGSSSGCVVVFERSAGVWSEHSTLTAPGGNAFDRFGTALAVLPGQVFVGCPGDDDAAADAGSVHAFEWTGTSWVQRVEIHGSSAAGGDDFGASLAADGGRLLVGAPMADIGGLLNAGRVYVFEVKSDAAREEGVLQAQDATFSAAFGTALSFTADRALVGAPLAESGNALTGAAYLFTREDASGWTQRAKLLATDGADLDGAGLAVALAGEVAAVGTAAALDSIAGALTREGAALLFDIEPGGSRERFKTFAGPMANADGRFAEALLVADDLLVCGAPREIEGGARTGAVHVFTVGASPYHAFCYGDGVPGCVSCPCANAADATSGGGCRNERGWSATLHAEGRSSLGHDSLRLTLRGATANGFAMLLVGHDQRPANPLAPCLPGAGVPSSVLDGLRCIGGAVRRIGVRATNGAGACGTTLPAWGGIDPPSGGLLAVTGFAAGETQYFQAFYRTDPARGCGSGQNTSNGVAVRVVF